MTNEQGAILERLEKLERQNRRMKLAGLGAMVIAGAFVLMGQASGPRTPPEVRAKSFVLVDAKGETRARLYMSASAKGPELTLLDANGNARAEMDAFSDSPELALSDAKGKVRARLVAWPDGPGLALSDAKGKVRARLVAWPDGPGLILNDANENSRVVLGADSDGPGLWLGDANGFETDIGVTGLVTPATGETHTTSAASIVLFGKDGKVLWSAPPQN
jgi:hypothetical protein